MYIKMGCTLHGHVSMMSTCIKFCHLLGRHDRQHQQKFEPRLKKTNVLVSDMVRHKPGCAATEDDLRLAISDLERRGFYQCSETKGADQLRRVTSFAE